MKILFLFWGALLFWGGAQAYTVKTETLLKKLTENSGSGVYVIDEEIIFPNPSGTESEGKEFALREQWTVFDDSHMKLVVSGPGGIHWVFVFENGIRYQSNNGAKRQKALTDQFFEKYFHFRKEEVLRKNLTKAGVDLETPPSLTRIAGVIGIVLGASVEGSTESRPVVIVEQDQFVLRKMRFSSGTEFTADQFSNFARGLVFPKLRSLRWTSKPDGNLSKIETPESKQEKMVSIQTLHVQAKFDKKPTLALEPSQGALPEGNTRQLVEEFYQRFR